ncbi:MAG TPA: radical SAM family heme chaperone HemW [Candidatus Saccharicenans sp.]|jgi:oxygen-independent coproporphyrinogen-3 oxidase|nr:radical SAM family heme chaperone HemW [Candidatus Saccharicenans sp.]HRD02710.1 radical SAM family heme chaperone HemW [Candidatus Saccharicenans sp.]
MIIAPSQLQEKIKINEKTLKVGIYFHYPICQKKCPYCHFYSYQGNYEDHELWLAAILKEISLVAGQMSDLVEIDTVYFGGGTPSCLMPEEIDVLLSSLKRNFCCGLEEITLEFNPGDHSEKLPGFRQTGINRLSLGAQSFSEKVLKTLGRLHSVGDILKSVVQARKAGLTNINLDLMIGLPGEDDSAFDANTQGIKAAGPEHLAVYMLEELDEVPFKKVWEENPIAEDQMAETYEKYQTLLLEMGYEQYEISNYARAGYACQHNLKYWEYKPVIGFGPSAASHLGFVRWQNIPDLRLWSEAVLQGQMNLAEYLVLGPEAALKEKLMSGLRLKAGVDRAQIKKEYPGINFMFYEDKIHQLVEAGCLEVTASSIRIPPGRFLIANSILSELLF